MPRYIVSYTIKRHIAEGEESLDKDYYVFDKKDIAETMFERIADPVSFKHNNPNDELITVTLSVEDTTFEP